MTKIKLFIFTICSLFLFLNSNGQIILNEISNQNSGQILDEDNEIVDWIEIYNPSSSAINLADYYLSDDSLDNEKWNFPSISLNAGAYQVVFASGKDRKVTSNGFHWESPVLPTHTFEYIVPTSSTSGNWKNRDFVATGWSQGKAGFGYGDNDDVSVVPDGSISVYVRKSFNIPSGFTFEDVSFLLDYDDGFVAYLNGTEIARSFLNDPVAWNSLTNAGHEATMYSGGNPDKITIDTELIRSLIVSGKNVLAIEVHNNSSTSADLSLIPYFSMKISDKYALFDATPANLIPSESNNLHTNFKIDGKGEKISLFNKKTNQLESVWVKNLEPGWSVGRLTGNSTQWGIYLVPTPKLVNSGETYTAQREPEPVFSVSEGFYTGKVSVKLSSTSTTAEIRYTKDGSDPNITSTLYTGTPISFSVSGILRAACFSKTGKLPSRSVSNSYFMNKGVLNGPVLSIFTDNKNLYGGTGIFDNWQQDWEKPCYVEYFDKDGKKCFEQFSGIQIDGGAGGSRSNPQHSFRLEFDHKIYGEGDVDYKLIPDRPVRTDYKSIYLRNGSNQYLTFMFKDDMECKITANNTKNYYSNGTHAIVYINGAYFGMYEMREKTNDEFFKVNYDAKINENFHLLSQSYWYGSVLRALNGNVETFNADYRNFMLLNPVAPDYLLKAGKILDLDYYTDYIVAESWIANNDWPFNNIKLVKGDFTNNLWRFILIDLEWSLRPNHWTTAQFDHINYMINQAGGPYIDFWKKLIQNTSYRKQFINRFADIMNTSYLPEKTLPIAQKKYDETLAEMPAEYQRWGGNFNQYAPNMNLFKGELNARSTEVRKHIISNFKLTGQYTIELGVQPSNTGLVQINTITPDVFPWKGIYFKDVPVRIEAKSVGSYVFDGWVANGLIKDLNNPVYEGDVKIDGYKFIAKFKLKTPDDAIAISEINYNSTDSYPAGDWIELHNYGTTAKDLNNWYLTDSDPTHKWVISGSVIIKPNERLVVASNLAKFTAVYPDVKNVIGSFEFGLGTPGDFPQLYNSTGKLVSGVNYSIEAPWPTGAFDKGMSLELKDVTMNHNLASNWFDGCTGGSPGKAYSKCIIAGNDELSAIGEARLYPNPASEEINIILPTGLGSQPVSYKIFDLIGKEIGTLAKTNGHDQTIRIDVKGFRNGIYVVQLIGENYRQSLKFVKQ
jgi:hypothetical protein